MMTMKDEKLFHLRALYALKRESEASKLLTDAANADLANIAASVLGKYPNAFYMILSQSDSGWDYHTDIWVEDILDETLNLLPDACEYANDLLENFDSPQIGSFAGVKHILPELAQWMPDDFVPEDCLSEPQMV
jgi:hypothetical protein